MRKRIPTAGLGVMALLLSIPVMLTQLMLGTPALDLEEPFTFPGTPAGCCAADYFRAFNSDDEQDMRAFILEYRSPSYLRDTPVDKQMKTYRFVRQKSGDLTPLSCFPVSDYELYVSSRTAFLKNGLVVIRFKVESAEPHRLQVFTIDLMPANAGTDAVDAAIIENTLDSLAGILESSYVSPQKGKEMADMLRQHKSSGRYAGITESPLLALRITTDLLARSNDQHLSVHCGPLPKDDESPLGESGPETNYGFREVKVLDGDIGYIRLDEFQRSEQAREAAGEAMAAVADCAALIFDLRWNGGGSPELGLFISSYLFDAPILLGSYYNRLEDAVVDIYTLENVPGRPFGQNKPVYILTGAQTFSQAENFTFCLQDLGRAVVVGEKTKGGGHAVRFMAVNERFWMRIPIIRAISPVSKRNWEAIGVTPDIPVPEEQALEVAREEAVRSKAARKIPE